jgi:hypothetical protein
MAFTTESFKINGEQLLQKVKDLIKKVISGRLSLVIIQVKKL